MTDPKELHSPMTAGEIEEAANAIMTYRERLAMVERGEKVAGDMEVPAIIKMLEPPEPVPFSDTARGDRLPSGILYADAERIYSKVEEYGRAGL